MGKEIERKYLVTGEYKSLATKSYNIIQGYITDEAESTVRVRIQDETAYITIKGIQTGITRYEWEKEISLADAKDLLLLCTNNLVEKQRHLIDIGRHTIEVDEFKGVNQGLTIAEIELKSEEEEITLPAWVGKEVSLDKRYRNSHLSKFPFKDWGR